MRYRETIGTVSRISNTDGLGLDGMERWEGGSRGMRYTYIYISDSYCDTAETKQTCKVVILQIKTFFKILELKFFRRKAEV